MADRASNFEKDVPNTVLFCHFNSPSLPAQHKGLKITLDIMASQLIIVAVFTLALLVSVALFQIAMQTGRSESSMTVSTSRVFHRPRLAYYYRFRFNFEF